MASAEGPLGENLGSQAGLIVHSGLLGPLSPHDLPSWLREPRQRSRASSMPWKWDLRMSGMTGKRQGCGNRRVKSNRKREMDS